MITPAKRPTASVIIPTYNRGHLLTRAITSVLEQTYRGFEIMVVDDGSNDGTEEIIKKFHKHDTRVRYVTHDKNKGGAAARNTGVKESRGKYIAFLDSDDEVFPAWLEKSIEKIKKLPESWGVLYPRYCIRDDLTGITYFTVMTPKEGMIYENLIRGKGLGIGTTGTVVKRKSFEEVGGFDENLLGFHDYDLWYRLAKKWSFHFLNEPSILFHKHQEFRLSEGNKTREEASRLFNKKWKNEIERIGGGKAYDTRYSKRIAGSYFSFIRREVALNGRLAAIRQLLHSPARTKIRPLYFLKTLLVVVVGPYCYDLFRRWRGILYWKLNA